MNGFDTGQIRLRYEEGRNEATKIMEYKVAGKAGTRIPGRTFLTGIGIPSPAHNFLIL
jgi:hypothetical protein